MSLEDCQVSPGVYKIDVAVVEGPGIYVSVVPHQFDWPRGMFIHHSPRDPASKTLSTSTKIVVDGIADFLRKSLGADFQAAVLNDDTGAPLPKSLDVRLPAGRSYCMEVKNVKL